MSDSKTSSGGVGFAGLLTIAFIVLKLCKVIGWSWWWVLSPMLFSIGIALLVTGYYLRKTNNLRKEYEALNRKREEELNKLRERYNEVYKSLNEVKDVSRWDLRMNEMRQNQQKGSH